MSLATVRGVCFVSAEVFHPRKRFCKHNRTTRPPHCLKEAGEASKSEVWHVVENGTCDPAPSLYPLFASFLGHVLVHIFREIGYEWSYPLLLLQDLQMPTLMGLRRARRAGSAWSRGRSSVVLVSLTCRRSMLTSA
jgi:hypothetical protein